MWFKSEKCNPSSMKQFHSLNLTTLPNNFNEKLLWFRSRLQRCSIKKVFLEISQNSQENTCARVSILLYFSLYFTRFNWTLSWRRSLPQRNQSIGLLCKSMDWFLYDKDIRHERVKAGNEVEELLLTFLKAVQPNMGWSIKYLSKNFLKS